MATKKTFVLRLDARVFNGLEQWASDEFRSMNGQIEFILSQALKKAGRIPKKKNINSQKEEGGEPE